MALLALGPLARTAGAKDVTLHHEQSGELARYKLARLTADDADGFHRVSCPAVTGKMHCALRTSSASSNHHRTMSSL